MFQDITTEWNLLGALIDPKNKEFVSSLTPTLFTDQRADVFAAIQQAEIDHGSVSFEGIRKHLKAQVPGDLLAVSANTHNIYALIDEAARLAKKRVLLESSQRIQRLAHEFNPDDSKIYSAFDYNPVTRVQDSTMTSAAKAFVKDFQSKVDGTYQFNRTGFKFLDSRMGGEWKPQCLSIVLGNVGSGKTVLVCNSMIRMAGRANPVPSLFISLEMSKSELMTRWLADRTNTDSSLLQVGNITENQQQLVEEETIAIQQLPMYLLEDESMTLAEMIYAIRRHIIQYGVKVVFIDYLQIANHAPTGQKNADLGDFALQLKNLAKREQVSIVVLSQVNSADGVDAIRDSGEVRAVAGVIMYLKPQDMMPGDIFKDVVIEWPKNRYGKTTSNIALFNGPYQRFEDAH